MPKLYIGNPTRQVQRIYYRLDFTSEGEAIVGSKHLAAKWQDIPAGQQRVVANRDLPIEAVQSIIQQLNDYGMLGVVDVKRGALPKGKAVPYVFNLDAEIPRSVLQTVFDHNRGAQMYAGQTLRQKAAIAGSEIVAQATGVQQEVFELEVEQEGENLADTPSIAEGYRVVKDGDRNPPPKRPKRAA
jgi:hypothetical protein